MDNDKKWYAVHTKPKYERKVAELLAKKKLQSYYPCYNQVQNWLGKRKIINVPLFTSLVFVRASDKDHSTIKQIDGVSGILYWLNNPAVISDDEIVSVRYFLEQHNDVKLEKIQMSSGRESTGKNSYAHFQPHGVISISNEHKVYLPSLGYALISEAMAENVKVVA